MTDNKEFPSEPQQAMRPGTAAPLKPTSSGRSEHGAAALTILCYALLLDAAVETFLSGSPVRWLVVSTVAAYLVLTVCLWRFGGSLWNRFEWSARASASFFVLLGLLAATAWMSEGLIHGVTALRQPTSVVLSAITALAVAFAGVALVRVRFLPWWGRAALGLLALYGVAAFAVGVIEGMPYPNLFQGGSLWRRLPYWLQGAFIGTLIAVPLAMVAAIVDAFKRLRAADGRGWGLQQGLALGLATLMAVSGLTMNGGPVFGVADPDRDASTGPGLRPAVVTSLPLPVERTHDFAQLDPSFYAAALGHDPQRIFEFVRDGIRFELYRGVLRGSRGTLLALAGNSLDRAILLGDLLRQSGQSVRFARGTLATNHATALVTSMWGSRDPSELPPEGDAAVSPHAAAALGAIERDYQLIDERLTSAGVTARAPEVTIEPLVREARPHYWIQWARGSDWIDMDPSFGDAVPGRRYSVVEEVLSELPSELYHTVGVRVLVEEHGSPGPRQVLAYEARAAELSGRDLVLVHVPENWGGPTSSISRAIASAVANRGRVMPILIAGGRIVKGDPLQSRFITSGLGGVMNLLAENPNRTQVPLASAEWLELDFRYPGGERETVVREIFDFTGKSRRAAGRPLTWDELFGRTQDRDAFDPSTSVISLLMTTGRIDLSHVLPLPSRPILEPEAKATSGALRALLLAFVATTDELWQRFAEAGRSRTISYPDTPRVHIAELTSTAASKRIRLDLRRDETRMVSRSGQPGDVLRARVLRGVVNGTIERKLLESLAAIAAAQPAAPPVMSTSLVFERAREQGIPAMVLSRDSTDLPTLPDDTAARLREDLQRGLMAIVPSRPISLEGVPRFAWWRVDPRSGDTIGVIDEGLHGSQSGPENSGQVGVIEVNVEMGALSFTQFWVMTLEGGMVYASYTYTFRAAMVIVAPLLREGYKWVPNIHPSWLPP